MFPTLQLVEIFDSGLFLIFLNVFSKPQAKPPVRYPVAPHGHLHAPGIVMLPTLLYSNIKQALDFVNIVKVLSLLLLSGCEDQYPVWCPIYKRKWGCSGRLQEPDVTNTVMSLCPKTCGLCNTAGNVNETNIHVVQQ